MIRKIVPIIFLFFLVMMLLGHPGHSGDNPREELNQYLSELQKNPNNTQLREKIIQHVQTMKPAPRIPEAAERYMARGKAAFEMARNTDGFAAAAAEFNKAVDTAPWLAEGYYNLGHAQESGGKFSDAMQSFRLYLLTAPSAKDFQTVKNRVYGLEYKAEQQRDELKKAEQQRLARQREEEKKRQIAGNWYDGNPTREGTLCYEVTVNGNNFEIKPTLMYVRINNYAQQPSWVPYKNVARHPVWRGTIEGLTLTGTFYGDNSNWNGGSTFTRPMSGSISPDGQTLSLRYKSSSPYGRYPHPSGWREIDAECTFRR